jgi:hypothetical protein
MKLAQDRRSDDGLGLGRGEFVVLLGSSAGSGRHIDLVGVLGSPDRPRRSQTHPGLP